MAFGLEDVVKFIGDFIAELQIELSETAFSILAAAILASPIWLIVRFLPSRRLWNTLRYSFQPWRKPVAPLIILSSTRSAPDTNGYVISRTGLGQVQAISHIAPGLASAYKEPLSSGAVYLSSSLDTNSPLLTDRDLILIGGPKTNHITRAVLEMCPLSVEFKTKASLTVKNASADVIVYRDKNSNEITELITLGNDAYAFLARFENPFSKSGKHTVTLLCGSSTYGTELAALAFSDRKYLRKYSPFFRKLKGFVAVAHGTLAGRSESDRWVGNHEVIHIEYFRFDEFSKRVR